MALVDEAGECTLFPTRGYRDLYSCVQGETPEERREKAWSWSDELNLRKRLFLSLAIRGRVTITSLGRLQEVYRERSSQELSNEEQSVLELVRENGARSSSELREVSGLSRLAFDRALRGLRKKMLLAIVGIHRDSGTKYIYVYDLTERWIRGTSE